MLQRLSSGGIPIFLTYLRRFPCCTQEITRTPAPLSIDEDPIEHSRNIVNVWITGFTPLLGAGNTNVYHALVMDLTDGEKRALNAVIEEDTPEHTLPDFQMHMKALAQFGVVEL